MLRLYYQSYGDQLPQRFVDEHEDMITVISARDVEAADQLAKVHAEQIVTQIKRLFTRDERLDIAL
ncbi:hypothetical protein D3C72_2399800 [compost metagenome]